MSHRYLIDNVIPYSINRELDKIERVKRRRPQCELEKKDGSLIIKCSQPVKIDWVDKKGNLHKDTELPNIENWKVLDPVAVDCYNHMMEKGKEECNFRGTAGEKTAVTHVCSPQSLSTSYVKPLASNRRKAVEKTHSRLTEKGYLDYGVQQVRNPFREVERFMRTGDKSRLTGVEPKEILTNPEWYKNIQCEGYENIREVIKKPKEE